jgi:predicted permease
VSFASLLTVITPVFFTAFVGFIARHFGLMRAEGDSSFLKLTLNILFPALIADSILGNPLLREPENLWLPPLLGLGLVSLGMGVLALTLAPFALPERTRRAGIVTAGIQNYGYLVIPIVTALFDKETLGVLFLFNVGVELGMWMVGVSVLSDQKTVNVWKLACNAPTLAIFVSAALNLVHIKDWMPVFVLSTMHLLGGIAVPMALILTGLTAYDAIREKDPDGTRWPALLASLSARLIALPLVFLAFAKWLPAGPALQNVLLVQAAMPAALFPIVLCKAHAADSRFSSQIAIGSTLVGFISIPFWIRFGSNWIGNSVG